MTSSVYEIPLTCITLLSRTHLFLKLGITSAVASEVPKPVIVFGLAGKFKMETKMDSMRLTHMKWHNSGGLPYIGASAVTIYEAYQAGLAAAGTSCVVLL